MVAWYFLKNVNLRGIFYISWHFVLCFFVGFPKFGHVGPPLVLSDLLLRKIDHKVVSKRQNAVPGAILSAQVIYIHVGFFAKIDLAWYEIPRQNTTRRGILAIYAWAWPPTYHFPTSGLMSTPDVFSTCTSVIGYWP